MTQCARILEYLDRHGTITMMEAVRKLGITSLHRRLKDIKDQGYIIGIERYSGLNRRGERTHYNIYSIIGREDKAA